MNGLPNSCIVVNLEPAATIESWVSEVPEEALQLLEDIEIKDHWYVLLQKVDPPKTEDPEEADMEAAIAASLAEAESEMVKTPGEELFA